ncbi:MAG: serine/threonine protein phosphatase [Ruminococcaceae bacterium]|nr:serine/threonine protein phosphatase [Oscillospiraceae bacterium]
MSLYVLGDLHLSFGTNKPMDIFKGWDNYVERITENWNNLVNDDDTVVVNGDISWAMSLEDTEKDFEYINNRLKGNKIFTKGNHDYWWTTKAKMDSFLQSKGFDKIKILNNNSYLVEGIAVCGTRGWINDDGQPFDEKILNREAGRMEATLSEGKKTGGELTVFIHYPPIFGGEKNYYILEKLKKYNIKHCYYGHVHGPARKKAFVGEYDGTEFHIASCDCVDFTPVLVKGTE